jgi:hypothetical protein
MPDKPLHERREELAAMLRSLKDVPWRGGPWGFSDARHESELNDRLRAFRAFGITARTEKEARRAAAELVRKWDEEAWAEPYRPPTEEERKDEGNKAEEERRAAEARREKEKAVPTANATWLLGEYRDSMTKHAVLVRRRNKALNNEEERHSVRTLDEELRALRNQIHAVKEQMTAAGVQMKATRTPVSERLVNLAEEERQAVLELEKTGDADAVEKAKAWYRERRLELFQEPAREELDYE